ncbi:MAG: CRISPR-associated helicase Cas3' [Pseudomonadota bacterium]
MEQDAYQGVDLQKQFDEMGLNDCMNKPALAHVKQTASGEWRIHCLEEHLREVGRLAAEMAAGFKGDEWAKVAGLWHDLGKYRPAFQGYIKKESGYDPEAHIEQSDGKVDHSTAGAIHAMDFNKVAGQLLAYLIAGHHAGLPDWNGADVGESALEHRLEKGKKKNYLNESMQAGIPEDILSPRFNSSKPLGGSEGLHLWLRMLFSCLVDADFLDTERFMEPEKAAARQACWSLQDLKDRFDAYMAEKAINSKATAVNQCRAVILKDCRKAGLESPGIYTLTVPTGGGKTLSGMAFALEHAAKHQKQRIIVAIPYTSIIEQTAEQYRAIFGEAVLEHHSNLDPEKENAKSRLAAENWDAPIVVTTNVQLLESLFAARTSRCRKLHNLVNSVIIIDEAQLLPPDYLQPILDVLRLLTENYGVTLVLSTATQPALGSVKDNFGRTVLRGLDARREIVSDVDGLFSALARVEVKTPADMSQRRTWEELANEICQHDSVLAIVNSRKDARELHRLMPKGTTHLSAQMCGEHRSEVIADIKRKLKNGEPVRVISTQLVEAGVDLDFPVVYRALAGLDSIAQAAGRCNREGKLEKGKVVVFVPPKPSPKGMLLYGEQATRSVWHGNDESPLSHKLFDAYFRQYFGQETPDKHGVMPLLTTDARQGMVQFRSAAKRFRLIDDAGQSVLVPYGNDGFKWLDMLRKLGPERYLMRKLQRYSVNVYENEFNKLRKIGAIEELHPGIWGLVITNGYDEQLGLLQADDLYCNDPTQSVM